MDAYDRQVLARAGLVVADWAPPSKRVRIALVFEVFVVGLVVQRAGLEIMPARRFWAESFVVLASIGAAVGSVRVARHLERVRYHRAGRPVEERLVVQEVLDTIAVALGLVVLAGVLRSIVPVAELPLLASAFAGAALAADWRAMRQARRLDVVENNAAQVLAAASWRRSERPRTLEVDDFAVAVSLLATTLFLAGSERLPSSWQRASLGLALLSLAAGLLSPLLPIRWPRVDGGLWSPPGTDSLRFWGVAFASGALLEVVLNLAAPGHVDRWGYILGILVSRLEHRRRAFLEPPVEAAVPAVAA